MYSYYLFQDLYHIFEFQEKNFNQPETKMLVELNNDIPPKEVKPEINLHLIEVSKMKGVAGIIIVYNVDIISL